MQSFTPPPTPCRILGVSVSPPASPQPLRDPVFFFFLQAFVMGAISRAVATVLVFPYIRAKVIIMSR